MQNRWRTPRPWSALAVLLVAAMLATLAAVALPSAPARAANCTEIVTNGGFETTGGWVLGASPAPPQYATNLAYSGTRSMQLGIPSGANIESFSPISQTVTIPPGTAQVTLSYWFYAMADAPVTEDYMELALLTPDGSTILARPWQINTDSRAWTQIAFDLSEWQGQTFQIYFNVYNDGEGGTTAMFLDDISLNVCPAPAPAPPGPGPTRTPTSTPTGTLTPTPTRTPGGIPPSATPSPTPGCSQLVRNGDFSGGLAFWQKVGDPSGVTVGTDQYYSPPSSLKLGSLSQSLNGLAAAQQMMPIPAGSPVVNLDLWIFTQSEPAAGADYQEIALLNSAGGLLFVPYRGPSNDNAWVHLQFNLAAFAGQTVFLRFAVNNDGTGGRTAMYVDDVQMTACSGVLPTASPSATWTYAPPPPFPTDTPTPGNIPPPPPPTYPVPTGCTELTQNGGFEAGTAGWVPGKDVLPPTIVTSPVLSGAYAVQLGTQTQNVNSYSSIRQTVSVPWGYARTIVSFWTYTASGTTGGGDKQQFVLLGPGNVVWAVPWKVLENNQAWQQHIFELVGVGGQTFDLYFAAVNDGTGGRTAMFLDEVHLWGCSGSDWPFTAAQAAPAPYASDQGLPLETPSPDMQVSPEVQAVPVPQVYPIETIPPELAGAVAVIAETATPGVVLPYAQWTEIAIAGAPGSTPAAIIATSVSAIQATVYPEMAGTVEAQAGTAVASTAVAQAGTAVALGNPTARVVTVGGTPVATITTTPEAQTFLGNLRARISSFFSALGAKISSITARWPEGWQKVVLAILAIVIIVLVIRWLRR